MVPTDVERLERRLRGAYERARLRSAVLGFAPMVLLVALASLVGHRGVWVLGLGAVLFGVGVLALWYGREPGRGVLPGALGGSLAAVLALCASQMTFLCTGQACLSWCIPACSASGAIAGGIVAFGGLRQQRGVGYWISATSITLLAGALGCSCMGYAGVGALAAGMIAVLALSWASPVGRRRTRHETS